MTGSSDAPRPEPAPPPGPAGNELVSTLDLLERFKLGDDQAVGLLVERSMPPLRRWARGRLPTWARSLAETQDLIQTALMRALPRLKQFEVRHAGALQAYLRQAVANHIRDEIRKVSSRQTSNAPGEHVDPSPSPLEQAIGREGFERYEAALAELSAHRSRGDRRAGGAPAKLRGSRNRSSTIKRQRRPCRRIPSDQEPGEGDGRRAEERRKDSDMMALELRRRPVLASGMVGLDTCAQEKAGAPFTYHV